MPVELGGVLSECVATLFPEDRRPVVLIPQIGIGCKIELWSTALTNVRAIGARDSENVETNVLPVIGRNSLVASVCYREVSVDDYVVAKGPRVTGSSEVGFSCAGTAAPRSKRGAAGSAESVVSRYLGTHMAKLEP